MSTAKIWNKPSLVSYLWIKEKCLKHTWVLPVHVILLVPEGQNLLLIHLVEAPERALYSCVGVRPFRYS